MPEKTYAHFIGAGGAGMSGIALVLAARGVRVTGSDLKESRYSRALVDAGIPVTIGHAAENLGDPEVVVISSAVPENNPELVEARRRNIEVWPRARMLAHLAGERRTIAVAGTHGKTTTSSMVASILARLGLEPTFLIGGQVTDFGTNAVNGAGEHFVVEADESDGSFVYLDPYVAVVTNIEADHLDHYGTLERVEEGFVDFMARTTEDGVLVVCGDQPRLVELARSVGRRVLTYGFGEQCDVKAVVKGREGIGLRFEIEMPDGATAQSVTSIPGVHMVSNAAAALTATWALGLDLEEVAQGLRSFRGVRRRFNLVGEHDGVTVVDDYAHHPTEIRATVAAARTLDFERVVVLFQAHHYSRTEVLAEQFGEAFVDADISVIMDIYAGSEEIPIPGVTGKTILDAILRAHPRAQAAYLPHRTDIVAYLADRVRPGDVVFTMGAGDVSLIGPELLREMAERSNKEAVRCQ